MYMTVTFGAALCYALYRWRSVREDWRSVPTSSALYILLVGVIGAISLYNFIDAMSAHASSSTTSTVLVTYVLPIVITAVLACCLFGERITAVGYISAAVVFAAVTVFALHGVRKSGGAAE